MSQPRRASAARRCPQTNRVDTQCLLLWALVSLAASLQGCGDDDKDDGAARVAASCEAACDKIVGTCALAPAPADCAAVCQLGAVVAPACTSPYEGYVNCTRDRPLVSCEGTSVAVDVSAPACLEPLGDYVVCAAEHFPACLALPLQDAECVAANLGVRASACAGAPAGCTLFEGTSRAGGFGVYCCP